MADVCPSNGEEVCQELVGVGNVENAVTSCLLHSWHHEGGRNRD